MKRIISLIAALATVLPLVCVPAKEAGAVNFRPRFTIHSESAIMFHVENYQNDKYTEIFEQNADAKQMPGPLVNIMTAIVCLENCTDLNEVLTLDPDVYQGVYNEISENDYSDDLPMMDLNDGDKLTVTDLLYCMMLTSSVEASETIAYHVGSQKLVNEGTAEKENISPERGAAAFVEMMNEKAASLGMNDTNFTNAHGMYDTQQYTTARDLSKLTLYAMKNSKFAEIANTQTYNPSVPNPETHVNFANWAWTHSNIMMDPENEDCYYMGAQGIKTAFLSAAGRNIITTANKDGNRYLVILLRAPFNDAEGNPKFYHINDAADLFDWAFEHFSYKVVLADTAEVGELPVKLADGNDYVLARPKEEISLIWYDDVDTSFIKKDNITWYKTELQAPVEKGEVLGEVTLEYEGESLGTVELVAVSSVERSKWMYNFEVAKRFKGSEWFKTALKVAIVLSALYILICIYALVLFKSKSKPLKPLYAVPKVDKKKRKKTSNKK